MQQKTKLGIRKHHVGTGPYCGTLAIAIYDISTGPHGDPVVSICKTADGWDVKSFSIGAGLRKLEGTADSEPDCRTVNTSEPPTNLRQTFVETGPYIDLSVLTVYDVSEEPHTPVVSICKTPDGWDVQPFLTKAGLQKLGRRERCR